MALFSGGFAILVSFAISLALNFVVALLTPKPSPRQQTQNQPTPPNGTDNERQPVPPRRDGFGRIRTGGDYVLFEEKGGFAYDGIAHISSRIEGYVQHWLHDEVVTVGVDGVVTAPVHFGNAIKIETRLGLNVETPWADAVTALGGDIWTNDHRGDGVSKVYMRLGPVNAEHFAEVYPQGPPLHTCLLDAAWVYDPRTNQDPDDPATWSFSRNIALGRLYHLTRPSGGRLKISDLYLPDWVNAANVCDQIVTNRDAVEENRYWGGLSWKYKGDGQDAVSIGQKIDEAGELVVYQRGDGLIGVHAGELDETKVTVRLDVKTITSIKYVANQSQSSTVLATRGRFTDPRNQWNPSDAAVYGDPYSGTDDTQRTTTVDNEAVESHNHIQRLQKLKFIRANAPKITVIVKFDETTADILDSRFIRVHYPRRGLDEGIVELINGVKLSLQEFTMTFDAIIVPTDLYAFDALTEEGIPGGVVGTIEATGVPVPTGLAVDHITEQLAGGGIANYVSASWTHFDDHFTHELSYQDSDAVHPPRSVFSNPGDDEVRTPNLPDNTLWRFRLRAWSAGAPSPWTDWIVPAEDTAGDVTPTADPYGPTVTPSGLINGFEISWVNPTNANFSRTELYRADGSVLFADAVLIYTNFGTPGQTVGYSDAGTDIGDFSYWIKSFNVANVGSNLKGPITSNLF